MSADSFKNKIVLVVILSFCSFAVYTAVTWIIGDFYGYKVRYSVEQWQKREELPDLSAIEQVLLDANAALNWEEGNPQYHELKARTLYYKALVVGLENEKALYFIRQAKNAHLQAIALRPRWPYSWANLALMKAYLSEWGSGFDEALSNAVRFGPWEQSVHLTVAHAGALSWKQLTSEQKRLVAANVERGIVRDIKPMKTSLNALQKRTVICAYMHRSVKQQKLCDT